MDQNISLWPMCPMAHSHGLVPVVIASVVFAACRETHTHERAHACVVIVVVKVAKGGGESGGGDGWGSV